MFDHEFQNFFKGFLDILFTYFDDPSKDAELNGETFDNSRSWQWSVLNTCISYYFDVLLHYKERAALDDWTSKLAIVPSMGLRAFLHHLAARTVEMRRNGIRTYLTDCPDDNSRSSAFKICTTAFHRAVFPYHFNCLRFENGMTAFLSRWNFGKWNLWTENFLLNLCHRIIRRSESLFYLHSNNSTLRHKCGGMLMTSSNLWRISQA